MTTLTITVADDMTIAELDDMTTAIMATASFWKEGILSIDCDIKTPRRND